MVNEIWGFFGATPHMSRSEIGDAGSAEIVGSFSELMVSGIMPPANAIWSTGELTKVLRGPSC